MLIRKIKAIVSLFLLASVIPVRATTVLVMVGPHGIITASDSLARIAIPDSESTAQKLFIIQNRIVVASIGHYDMQGTTTSGPMHYNFLTWMKQLQSRLPPNISVDDLAERIRIESAAMFGGFDAALGRSNIKRPNPIEACEDFIQYVIASYYAGRPRVFVVHFYINWDEKKLIGPIKVLEPFEGDFGIYPFGVTQAIGFADVLDGNSYAHKQAMRRCPTAFEHLLAHEDISLDETLMFAATLIKIQEDINPSEVGGAVQAVKISPDGRAEKVGILPKCTTGQQDKTKTH